MSRTLVASVATAASADGGEALTAARALFADALRDEHAGHFAQALDKFEQVRAVRDTPSIEYRIGTCNDGLGRPVPAYVAFRRAAELAQGDPRAADVSEAASSRLQALSKDVALLSLVLPDPAPISPEVRVDDAVVPLTSLGEPVVLAPGQHTVTMTSAGAATARSEVVLSRGARVSMTLPVEAPAPAPSDGAHASAAAPPQPERMSVAASPATQSFDAARRTAGWIGVGAGGALLAAGAIALVLRTADVSRLETTCPGGACPAGVDPADLESTRNRALVEGPLAAIFAVLGAGSAGWGAYMLITSTGGHAAAVARVEPYFVAGGAGAAVVGRWP